ncbi:MULTISPECIES: hypothetical protein [Tenacibaculum]|uniref:hypothetical protein n=1 Tax=Tenacibaculum TaxID=104267 RepID=UPI000C7C2C38
MNIEQFNKIIIGKWKLDDGRILDFSTKEDFLFTDASGETHSEKEKFFSHKNKYDDIQIMIPTLAVGIGIIRSLSINEIIYDDFDTDGSKTEFVLTRI